MAGLFISDGAGGDTEILDPSKVKVMVYTYEPISGKVLSRQWEDVLAIRAMVSGAWMDIWPKPFANIENYVVLGGGILAGYRINSNGNAEWINQATGQPFPTYTYGVIEQWLKKGNANQFVVKAVKDPNPAYAAPDAGSPLDQWIDCSTNPYWALQSSGLASLLTVTIGRVDGNGGGAQITTDAAVDLQTDSGAALTDTTITVTPMDDAKITLNTWTD